MLRLNFPDLAKSLSLPEENALSNLLAKSFNQSMTQGTSMFFLSKFCISLTWFNLLVFILFPKLFWPTVRKTLEIRGWRLRICKMFEIARAIYSNSERSEQFLKPNSFLTCSWSFFRSNICVTAFKLKKNIGKVKKCIFWQNSLYPDFIQIFEKTHSGYNLGLNQIKIEMYKINMGRPF